MANRKVEVRLAPTTHDYLDDLVAAGTHGRTATDVARTLIEEGIRKAIADKIISVRSAKAEG